MSNIDSAKSTVCGIVQIVFPFKKNGLPTSLLKASKCVITLSQNSQNSRLFEISISTTKNIGLHKFDVSNASSLHTTFIQEGKISIEFKIPKVTLMIRDASISSLHDFVNIFREIRRVQAIESYNSISSSTSTNSVSSSNNFGSELNRRDTLEVDQSNANSCKRRCIRSSNRNLQAQQKSKSSKTSLDFTQRRAEKEQLKKIRSMLRTTNAPGILKVTKRENYPKSFSADLTDVTILEIGLIKLDKRLLKLNLLQHLTICGNLIKSIELMKKLPCKLITLDVKKNPIGDISKDFFDSPAFTNLKTLNLEQICASSLPPSVVRLKNLNYLNASNNCLEVIPYNIHFMTELKVLMLQNNNLRFIPVNVRRMKLTSLDVSGNPPMWSSHHSLNSQLPEVKAGETGFPSLMEVAAQVVATYNARETLFGSVSKCIPVGPTSAPALVRDYLDISKYCDACAWMSYRYTLATLSISMLDVVPYNFINDTGCRRLPYLRTVICSNCTNAGIDPSNYRPHCRIFNFGSQFREGPGKELTMLLELLSCYKKLNCFA